MTETLKCPKCNEEFNQEDLGFVEMFEYIQLNGHCFNCDNENIEDNIED